MSKKRMFYKANLASVVWDPANDKPLAEFYRGRFVTTDPKVAEKLLAMGYPEVDPGAKAPPPIPPPPIQPEETPDVPLAGAFARENVPDISMDDGDEEEVQPVNDDHTQDAEKPAKAKPKATVKPKAGNARKLVKRKINK